MGLDTKINTHLNNIDTIKDGIKKDIETLFDKLNVKNLMEAPGDVGKTVIFAITERIAKKYIKPILKESQRYVDSVIEPESNKEL